MVIPVFFEEIPDSGCCHIGYAVEPPLPCLLSLQKLFDRFNYSRCYSNRTLWHFPTPSSSPYSTFRRQGHLQNIAHQLPCSSSRLISRLAWLTVMRISSPCWSSQKRIKLGFMNLSLIKPYKFSLFVYSLQFFIAQTTSP